MTTLSTVIILFVCQPVVVNFHVFTIVSSRNSSVGIATRFGLEGPGIESRWGRNFPHLSRRPLRPTQPPIQWVPEVKRPGRGVDYPPISSAGVKERVELYPYFSSGP